MTAFPHLQKQQYMSLVTFRKNGDAVPTAVWFAQVGDKLYVFSDPDTGKIKRLRHTTRVTVAPCTIDGTVKGEAQEATARIMNADEGKLALDALRRKYGWQMRGLEVMENIMEFFRRSKSTAETLYLEITPA